MRGLILIELLDFAAREYPPALDAPRYEALAAYEDGDFETILARIQLQSGVPRGALLRRFGRHLFARFTALFPVFPAGADSALDLLADLESKVHRELRGLAAGLDPPKLLCAGRGSDWVELRYRSAHRVADLVEGLVMGCADHFGEQLELRRDGKPDDEIFTVRRLDSARHRTRNEREPGRRRDQRVAARTASAARAIAMSSAAAGSGV